MQTKFTPKQLADPVVAEANDILRKCVHCGFCTATCPTYVLRGDELDSPRGRIYQIKEMYEEGGHPSPTLVKHLDRCLTCLSCMTTCPSGVDYMHLVEGARVRIESDPSVRRRSDRAVRWLLSRVMTDRRLFRLSLRLAHLSRPIAGLLPGRLRHMVSAAPKTLPSPSPALRPRSWAPSQSRKARVALLTGCAQAVLDTEITEATIRLLTRHGVEVVVSGGAECCGALPHHMGKEDHACTKARSSIEAWWTETCEGGGQGLDAVVITTSGCGTTVKDYGHMFRLGDPAFAQKAKVIGGLALDITELMERIGLQPPSIPTGQRVAYHAPCSLQHGQRVRNAPKDLLRQAGFIVSDIAEGHICCGSAGTYSVLQPELSDQLKARKVTNIEAIHPDVVASGNLGCMMQIGSGTPIPVVHTVQLLDWATGGPRPGALAVLPQ